MAKYHINAKGEAGTCSAKSGKCPFGGEADHYSSPEEAQKAYENSMSGGTFEPLKKSQQVVSLAEFGEEKERKEKAMLDRAREDANFDESWEKFPKYLLTKSELKTIEDAVSGKKINSANIDSLLENQRGLALHDVYNDSDKAVAAGKVFNYLTALRSTTGVKSTLITLGDFDPTTHTLFSNKNARKNAAVAGKAIRREAAHAEWMYELAAQHRASAAQVTDGDDISASRYLQSAQSNEYEAIKSEARVQAQIAEIQSCFDNDPDFAASANADIKRVLSAGWFRPRASSLSNIPIGNVTKIK